MIGRTLSHYRIERKIGAGGMGEVYLARDTRLGREVAIKMLPPDADTSEEKRQRFLHEARTLAALNHPHIVAIYSLEEHEGVRFLCMELVRGKVLGEEIPPDGLPENPFFDLGLQLTDGLAAAHEVGVIHRDLKPSNLMVTPEGRLKILDFGLATFVDVQLAALESVDTTQPLNLTREGTILGTVPYMSPEQIENKTIDPRSDVFALGILLYEMAGGQRPFHGDTAPGLMSSILKDVPPPVTNLRPEMPVALNRIIERCLEKDPRRRFQTVRDVNNELRILKRERENSAAAGAPLAPAPAPARGPQQFDHDIFISYAHMDNEAQLAGQQGWVSAFHRSVEVRVGQLLGKKPRIWREPKLQSEDAPGAVRTEKIPNTALLITVLSPRYVKTEWCTRELREFVSATTGTGGPRWGAHYRIFKVVKTPTPVEKHPAEIQPLPGYEFFKVDPETGRPRELDQIFGPEAQRDYWARLDDLAHDIVELLESVEAQDAGSTDSDSPGATPAPNRGSVYLASASHDLRDEHDALRRDLQRHGYAILPDEPLPLVESELERFVAENLAQSRLSVHLIGRHYGMVPEGATTSVIELQSRLATERAARGEFTQLLWIPAGVEAADDRQRQYLERVRRDPSRKEGSDLLETPFEDLKTVIHQVLNPSTRRAEPRFQTSGRSDLTHVYLICDQRDQEATSPLADYLFEKGFEITLPIFDGDEAGVREDHEDNLRQCDAVLVYYGAGNELWLRQKLREVQKSPALGRAAAMRAMGIWVAPPQSAEKSRFRTREALVMTADRDFSPDRLQPFLSGELLVWHFQQFWPVLFKRNPAP